MSEILEHEDNNSESARQLATISTIRSVQPVPDSDRLDAVTFSTNGWTVVMGRGDCKPGDKICFFEIDAFLPKEERYTVLEGRSNKTLNGTEGYRIKSVKLRGQISQGFAVPLTQFPEIDPKAPDGTDVTKELNIKLWERPVIGGTFMMGYRAGSFPTHLAPKTDQVRIQSMSKRDILDILKYNWEVTEKIDGTSTTILCYYSQIGPADSQAVHKFTICSRNMQIKPPGVETITYTDNGGTERTKEEMTKSVYWDMESKYGLEKRLTSFCSDNNRQLAIQAEICGRGIQKNPLGLPDVQMFAFDIYDISAQRYISAWERRLLIEQLNGIEAPGALPIQCVPLVGYQRIAPLREQISAASADMERACQRDSAIQQERREWDMFADMLAKYVVDDLVKQADGKTFNGHGKREGLVYKASENPAVSFKTISNAYLLAEKD